LPQRFYQSPYQQGNPNLKPERSLGWDLGAERSFFQNRFTLGVTLFQNRIWNLISWEGNTNINRAKARTQGLEGIAKLQITKEWAAELAHTYTQAWDGQTRLALVRRPLNKTTLRVVGQITPEWQVSGNILYVGARYDNDSQNFLTPVRIKKSSYTTMGAETSYQLNDQWQIYGRGENLLNRRYEDPDGFQQPGFGVYAGVRAQW
jgi:vitamin B12 transporter